MPQQAENLTGLQPLRYSFPPAKDNFSSPESPSYFLVRITTAISRSVILSAVIERSNDEGPALSGKDLRFFSGHANAGSGLLLEIRVAPDFRIDSLPCPRALSKAGSSSQLPAMS